MGLFNNKPSIKKMLNAGDVNGLTQAFMLAKMQEDISVQKEAVLALGSLKDRLCVPSLIKILNDEKLFYSLDQLSLLADIAWALGEIGDERAIAPLKKLTKIELGTGLGGGSSFEDMMRQAAQIKNAFDNVKDQAKKAIEKINRRIK